MALKGPQNYGKGHSAHHSHAHAHHPHAHAHHPYGHSHRYDKGNGQSGFYGPQVGVGHPGSGGKGHPHGGAYGNLSKTNGFVHLERIYRGIIKSFSIDNNYGFIKDHDFSEKIGVDLFFCGGSNPQLESITNVRAGQIANFAVNRDEKDRIAAVNIDIVGIVCL